MILHGSMKDQLPARFSSVSVEEAIMGIANVPHSDDILEELQSHDKIFCHYGYIPAKYSIITLKHVLLYIESGKLATALRRNGFEVTTNKRDYLRRRVIKTEEKLIRNTAVMDLIMNHITDMKWTLVKIDHDNQVGIHNSTNGELHYNPQLNTLEDFLSDNLLNESDVKRR